VAELPDSSQTAIRERAQADTIPGAGALDHGRERFDRGPVLRIDDEAHRGPAPQQVLEAGHLYATTTEGKWRAIRGKPVPGVCSLDLRDAQPTDGALDIGAPVQSRVVAGHDHSVAGHMRVGLEIEISERGGRFEGLERVLGGLACTAAMRDRDRRRLVEERVTSTGHQ
jgi:hypothetical protein